MWSAGPWLDVRVLGRGSTNRSFRYNIEPCCSRLAYVAGGSLLPLSPNAVPLPLWTQVTPVLISGGKQGVR